jgi:hypothetical protein
MPPWSNWVFHGPETVAERDVKVDTGMRAPMPGALNSMSPRVVRRHMSVFGGVGIVKGLVVSEGTVELDALIASYVRDMLGDWLSVGAIFCENRRPLILLLVGETLYSLFYEDNLHTPRDVYALG